MTHKDEEVKRQNPELSVQDIYSQPTVFLFWACGSRGQNVYLIPY